MPTAKELLDVIAHANSALRGDAAGQVLASRVEKVLALHAELRDGADNPVCKECSKIAAEFESWPCPTVRILNGEE